MSWWSYEDNAPREVPNIVQQWDNGEPSLDPNVAQYLSNGGRVITMAAAGASSAAGAYAFKTPCRTSKLTDEDWLYELTTGNDKRIYESFRMELDYFDTLCDMLRDNYGLQETEDISYRQSVGMFLYALSSGEANRRIQERFQHSGETVHRHFYKVLEAVRRMSTDYIVPGDLNFVHPKVAGTPFHNAIGAIDGTHVPCTVPYHEQLPYINRKGTTSQNVMAVCNFDMLFTYVLAGWEGSTHDARILNAARTNPELRFPDIPSGKYYLVDSGYANTTGYLGPYRNNRYHVPHYHGAMEFNSPTDLYNYSHSRLRCTIERAFGVLKNKWRILKTMPPYPFQTQVEIVFATMALHNFIRLEDNSDLDFRLAEAGQLEFEFDDDHDLAPADPRSSSSRMNALRDRIRDELAALHFQH